MAETLALKLTPTLRAMMRRIAEKSPLLELSVTASGGRSQSHLSALIRAGYVKRVEHPTVIDRRFGGPADALTITQEGLAALDV